MKIDKDNRQITITLKECKDIVIEWHNDSYRELRDYNDIIFIEEMFERAPSNIDGINDGTADILIIKNSFGDVIAQKDFVKNTYFDQRGR